MEARALRIEVMCKFDQLRRKTDKQLIEIVVNGVDSGLDAALEALRSNSSSSAEELLVRANRAYTKASRLTFTVYEFSDEELYSVESRLGRLREVPEALKRRRSNEGVEKEISALVGVC